MATQIRNLTAPPTLNPNVTVFKNFLYMASRRSDNNEVTILRFDGRQWVELGSAPGVRTPSQPALNTFQDRLYLGVRGEDNFIYLSAFDGVNWGLPRIVPGAGRTLAGPTLSQYGNLLHVIYSSEMGARVMWVSFNPNFNYGTYTVQPGQANLRDVSLALFGNPNRHRELAVLNHIQPIPGTDTYPVAAGDILLTPAA